MESQSAPTLSVVIPHHGSEELTRRLVSQLASQASIVGAQLIVVDDASPLPLTDVTDATVVRRHDNGGFGAAVNTGAQHATGDLLMILNSDLKVGPRFLSEYLAAASRWHPAVTAPTVHTAGHHGAHAFRFPRAHHEFFKRVAILGRFRTASLMRRLIGEDPATQGGGDHLSDWVSGAAILLPRESFDAVGGFSEAFFMYYEEVDLQRRLRQLGLPSVTLGSVLVTHLGFGSSPGTSRENWALESAFTYADKVGWPVRLSLALHAASTVTLTTDMVRRVTGREVRPWHEFRTRSVAIMRAQRSSATRRIVHPD